MQREEPVGAGGRTRGERHQADVHFGGRRRPERQLHEVQLTPVSRPYGRAARAAAPARRDGLNSTHFGHTPSPEPDTQVPRPAGLGDTSSDERTREAVPSCEGKAITSKRCASVCPGSAQIPEDSMPTAHQPDAHTVKVCAGGGLSW